MVESLFNKMVSGRDLPNYLSSVISIPLDGLQEDIIFSIKFDQLRSISFNDFLKKLKELIIKRIDKTEY